MKVNVDGKEVAELEKVLVQATAGVIRDVKAVVEKGAVNIKKDARKRIGGLAHARRYPYSITYDMRSSVMTGPTAEIGPDKSKRQGALGNILEYGTVNNPPHPHMRPAAEAELPKFERALQDLADKTLGGR